MASSCIQAALTGLGGFEKGGGREVWVGGRQNSRRRKKELEAGRSGGAGEENEEWGWPKSIGSWMKSSKISQLWGPPPLPLREHGSLSGKGGGRKGRVVSDLGLASPGCPDKSHVLEPSPLPHNHFSAHLILLKAPANGCCLSPL